MDERQTDHLADELAELETFELPVLHQDSFKCGAAMLSDHPTAVTQPGNIYALLDHYVTRMFPARFDWSPVFQWAGGPQDGRQFREQPDEEEFETDEDFAQAEANYYKHLGEPAPWVEVTATGGQRELIRAFLRDQVQWTINNKRYRIPRLFGRVTYLSFSMDKRERKMIAEQEAEHQRRRTRLIDLFVNQVSEPFRFFHTYHVLDHASAQQRGWDMQRDEIYVIVDPRHLRVLWVIHDRYYG